MKKFLFTLFLLFSSNAHSWVRTYADVTQVALPLTALGMAYYKNDKEGMAQLTYSFLSTISSTFLLKYSLNVRRPNGGNHSFPSGHTASAFSGAAFIDHRYGGPLGKISYVAAAGVGLSRVATKHHSWQDVIIAAFIAESMSYLFVSKFKDNRIKVVASPEFTGISISIPTGYKATNNKKSVN